jgi:amino-acid N-acetyltransferase
MEIINAASYKDEIVDLLKAEKLPVDDLPASLENFLVATENDEVVGTVGLEYYGEYALLRSLAVKKENRSSGLAGNLLTKIEGLAQSNNAKEIFLLTETAPDYFTQKGYLTVSRAEVPVHVQQSSEFSHVCPVSAIVMKKLLQ